ncbi:hypothetical protein ACH4FX_12090 [Streptomyces sp. NPDC018019]|uniref:hypothetical protein n=1 Tax=Streptomyces sp. NPDC018019 TaxID=3365030 RepID=UPI0037BCB47F
MTTPFAQPAKGGDFFSPRNHPEWLGKLFLIYPDGVVQKTFQPEEGPVDIVEADVVIIDLPDPQTGQPVVMTGASIGGKGLVPQLKKQVGAMVLGRLQKAAPQGQKDGAYFLADYTDADAQMAMAYVQAHPRQQFTQPQVQQAPPAVAPYGQPPQNVTQMPGYGGSQPNGAAPAPQHVSQALPYDPWQGTATAPGPAPQGAPAGPPAGQWGTPPAGQQPLPPTAPSNGAATAAPAAAAPPLDPGLADFLRSKGVNPDGMSDAQARMIAQTFAPQ